MNVSHRFLLELDRDVVHCGSIEDRTDKISCEGIRVPGIVRIRTSAHRGWVPVTHFRLPPRQIIRRSVIQPSAGALAREMRKHRRERNHEGYAESN